MAIRLTQRHTMAEDQWFGWKGPNEISYKFLQIRSWGMPESLSFLSYVCENHSIYCSKPGFFPKVFQSQVLLCITQGI